MSNIFNKDWVWWAIAAILIVISFVVFVNDGNVLPVQLLAACLGAIITVIATRLLLSKQSQIEEQKKQSERAHEKGMKTKRWAAIRNFSKRFLRVATSRKRNAMRTAIGSNPICHSCRYLSPSGCTQRLQL